MLFAPAVRNVEAKWPLLTPEVQARLVGALPDVGERLACLEWNARLSTMDAKLVEPCQAIFAVLQDWQSLSVVEQVAVFTAGIGPMAELAKRMGLVGGAA